MKKLILLLIFLAACSEENNKPFVMKDEYLSTPTADSSSYSFGENIPQNTTVVDKTFTFSRETGSAEVAGSAVILSNTTDFAIVSTNGCNRDLVKTSDKCYVKVRLLKKNQGFAMGSLQVGSPDKYAAVELSASIAAPSLSSGDLSLKEGSVVLSEVSFSAQDQNTKTSKTLSITNNTLSSVTLSLAVSGSDFSLSTNNCPASLASKKNCYIKITFSSPGASGSDEQKNGQLSVANSLSFPISGIVRGIPVVSYAPFIKFFDNSVEVTSLNLGLAASASISKVIVIENSGNGINQGAISLSGSSAFSLSSNNCGSSISAGKSCQVRISLAYSNDGGKKTASLIVGSFSLAIEGEVGIYTAIFVDPINDLLVCQGQVNRSKNLSQCKRDKDGATVDNSFCADKVAPLTSLASPEGQLTVNIANGTEVRHCDQGSTVQFFVSRTCNSSYDDNGSGCVSSAPSFFNNWGYGISYWFNDGDWNYSTPNSSGGIYFVGTRPNMRLVMGGIAPIMGDFTLKYKVVVNSSLIPDVLFGFTQQQPDLLSLFSNNLTYVRSNYHYTNIRILNKTDISGSFMGNFTEVALNTPLSSTTIPSNTYDIKFQRVGSLVTYRVTGPGVDISGNAINYSGNIYPLIYFNNIVGTLDLIETTIIN